MATLNEGNNKTLAYLSERIVKALDVLERKDFYAARLILADLWRQLEEMLVLDQAVPRDSSSPVLSPGERRALRNQAATLAAALRERPQSESQEMAQNLERILKG